MNSCINNLLKVICLIQDNSSNKYCFNNNCIKPWLGPAKDSNCFNTRVLTLYNKDGSLFTTNYFDNDGSIKSCSNFRVESVNNGFSVLSLLNDNYELVHQTITINNNCICAIKCTRDIFLNI